MVTVHGVRRSSSHRVSREPIRSDCDFTYIYEGTQCSLITFVAAMLATSALNNHAQDSVFTSEENSLMILDFYTDIRSQLEATIEDLLNSTKEWKVHSCLDVDMVKGKSIIDLLIF